MKWSKRTLKLLRRTLGKYFKLFIDWENRLTERHSNVSGSSASHHSMSLRFVSLRNRRVMSKRLLAIFVALTINSNIYVSWGRCTDCMKKKKKVKWVAENARKTKKIVFWLRKVKTGEHASCELTHNSFLFNELETFSNLLSSDVRAFDNLRNFFDLPFQAFNFPIFAFPQPQIKRRSMMLKLLDVSSSWEENSSSSFHIKSTRRDVTFNDTRRA